MVEAISAIVPIFEKIFVAGIGVLSAIIGYHFGARQLYVDTVINRRVQAIEELRRILKELYYYTNPIIVEMSIQNQTRSEEICNLLKAQSALEHRLLEALYPDEEVLMGIRKLVKLAIEYTEGGKKDPQYDRIRDEKLKLLKFYNFASWQYVQKHSTGSKGGSIRGFDKELCKTLKLMDQDKKIKNAIERLLVKYKLYC